MTLRRFARMWFRFAPPSLMAALFTAAPTPAQAQSSQPQAQSQPQGQAPAQPARSSPSAKADEPQMQTVEGAKTESLGDAARKAKAQKAKADSGKVMTEDDLHSLRGGGVSVVGEANSRPSYSSPNYNAGTSARDREEQYWRGRARNILDQIASVDRQIEQTKEEIQKNGAVGFDPALNPRQAYIVIEDRNAKVKALEDRKAQFEKELDALQEEGRKAGADSSWLR